MDKNQAGIIGLGTMGGNFALNIAGHGFRVAGFDLWEQAAERFRARQDTVDVYNTLEGFVDSLDVPRKIILFIPAGKPVDDLTRLLLPLLDRGDMLIDGGNSYYRDTQRRAKMLDGRGIVYYGMGVSGGANGARYGASLMPSGEKSVFGSIRPMLDAAAAKVDGEPCCAYIGGDGSGHYVKMVHNGIEYADMQLIAETYLVLKQSGYTNERIAGLFERWNGGRLGGFLMEITAQILRMGDDLTDSDLVDMIADNAGNKGTGRWTCMEAMERGVAVTVLQAAYDARVVSADTAGRGMAGEMLGEKAPLPVRIDNLETVLEDSLYIARLTAYSQGFSLMAAASAEFGWDLDLSGIANIFRGGCIIQSALTGEISKACRETDIAQKLLFAPLFAGAVADGTRSLHTLAGGCVELELPVPAYYSAMAYLDALKADLLGANLIQAQRDKFGAHTYERRDREGSFHFEWEK